MKKVLVLLTVILFSMPMRAQNLTLLDSIKNANANVMTLEAIVHNHTKKTDRTIEKDGAFYYSFSDKFSAVFKNDSYMIVNGDHIKVDIGMFHGTFRMWNGPIRSLTRAFLYALQGRCQDLAEENNFSLRMESDNNYHQVIFTTKKKILIGIGLKQAIFRYDINSLLLKEIVLIDYKGSIDTYTLENEKYNAKIKEGIFDI
jgi:outer membrane lipoprotein-sorting protein